MEKTQSARTINKANKAILKPSVKRSFSTDFFTVDVYTTPKGLVFLLPRGMNGSAYRRFIEAHQDDINDCLKTL